MTELLTRAERVLKAGRSDAASLIELIREVNPTGRELDAKTERRRYALKSRLQSLLLRLYPDDIEVTPAGDSPGIVGLSHRRSDACHAVIDDLDVDVRARVRFRLDTAPAPEPQRPTTSAPPKRPTPSGVGLLEQGRAALGEYDFDAARSAFTDALAAGVDGAAEVLLELLVDHLAAYDEALALEPELGDSPRLRATLAVAAARAGRASDALRPPRASPTPPSPPPSSSWRAPRSARAPSTTPPPCSPAPARSTPPRPSCSPCRPRSTRRAPSPDSLTSASSSCCSPPATTPRPLLTPGRS
ncbi:MAG: hypothetical protein JNK82_25955 [Myxococcaceae bacterium]|nr:hypothetical protein [Myxococcaceae bacterium]